MDDTEPTPEVQVQVQEPGGEQLQPLMCRSCALKVSIHCQGCMRKVKKVLQSIDGVYHTTIDLRQQKVVVMGIVDSNTLIKKLIQTGKRAELWPDQDPIKKKKKKKKKKANPDSVEKQSEQESSDEGNQSEGNEKETVKVVVQDTANKNAEGGNNMRNSEGCGINVTSVGEGWPTGRGSVQFQELKPDVRQVVSFPAGNQLPVAEKKVTIAVENGVANDGCCGGKKNKSKGQKGNNSNGNEGVSVTFDHTGEWNQMHGHGPHGHGPGSEHAQFMGPPPNESTSRHWCAPHYHTPASPTYGGSFHTAQPTHMCHCATCYTTPQPYLYAYVRQDNRSDSESYTSRPSCSFELLSDENPNACLVM